MRSLIAKGLLVEGDRGVHLPLTRFQTGQIVNDCRFVTFIIVIPCR
jgi:hypothetical protein